MQNAISLIIYYIEKLKPKACIIEDLNTNYQKN